MTKPVEIPDAFKIKDEPVDPALEKKVRDLKDALKGCIDAMQTWGAQDDEDGIPGYAWPAFVRASEVWRIS